MLNNPSPYRNGSPLTPYTETQLENGFTLVHKHVNTAPIVAIDFWIHTGAVHDPKPHLGLSHFYEHMFFKGTQTHGVGVMDRVITELGGYNNAATSYDYTHYYVVLPTAGWKRAMEVMLDSLLNPLFPEEEIERERSVIEEEIKRHEDSPWSKIYECLIQDAFAQCPYQRRVLGDVDSLQSITRETFAAYQEERYHPANTTLSVVGDVSLDEVQTFLASLIPPASAAPAVWQPDEFAMIDSPKETVIERDVNQSYLLIAYPTPRLIGAKHEYAIDLFSTLLGDGRSSRLHRRLHDELGLVSSISASYWAMVHAGLFVIEAVTEPDSVKRVEEAIYTEVRQLRENMPPDEIDKSKNIIRTDYAFANEKAISIANTYGYSRVAADIEHTVNYINNLDAVGPQDLERTFDEFITPQRQCKALLLPKKN